MKIGTLLFSILAISLMLGIASGNAVAQGDSSTYFTTYYSNANTSGAPDGTVRIINDGDTGGNLWASIYVFDDSQELQECCSCEVTPDGLLSESVNVNLTANALTGKKPTRGVIKVISSSSSDPTADEPTTGLRVWSTHVQRATATAGAFYVTETKAADSNLSSGEQALLQNLCYYDSLLSGLPCSCTPEDHDF
ncbi:MAG: hypothetical protein WBW98_12395 [Candidatus Sulfotelmatobacter sp.]|jgi:hypothetical protein